MSKRPKITLKRNPPKRVAPVGDLDDWSAADIARMAEVTEEDKFSALAFWQANAGARFKGLLQAKKRKRWR